MPSRIPNDKRIALTKTLKQKVNVDAFMHRRSTRQVCKSFRVSQPILLRAVNDLNYKKMRREEVQEAARLCEERKKHAAEYAREWSVYAIARRFNVPVMTVYRYMRVLSGRSKANHPRQPENS